MRERVTCSPAGSHQLGCPLSLCRLQAFFDGDVVASEETRSALQLAWIRRFRSARTISFSLKSGCSPIRARILCECFSKGEILPPRGMGSDLPSLRKLCTHLIAELTLTSNCSAASRRDPPASTKSMTRTLIAPGYGPCIA